MKKILITTGGGDCPGLNAVIRGIVKSALEHGDYEVWGSIEAFNGVMHEPMELIKLTNKAISGIHVKGGTIIKTTNKGNPLDYPTQLEDGTWTTRDRSSELISKIKDAGFYAAINIGGDGSQKISLALSKKGLNVVGVPKTIDNDLSATDRTFGFATAVEIATESFDRLVTTAESHNRVMIMEVMGRDAGWIALHTAIAGGAEICLIPEIPYSVQSVVKRVNKRYKNGRGFANIVIAEGAKCINGDISGVATGEIGEAHIKLGGIANLLKHQLEVSGCEGQVRSTILGHVQRGGTPSAFDRILATSMGVKAFEMVQNDQFGQMVSYRNHELTTVSLEDAVKEYNFVKPDNYLINTARKMGVSFGD
jgi:ATP-dependent phosphofructokinase / diphosphate-dependent phosphofructokinase